MIETGIENLHEIIRIQYLIPGESFFVNTHVFVVKCVINCNSINHEPR